MFFARIYRGLHGICPHIYRMKTDILDFYRVFSRSATTHSKTLGLFSCSIHSTSTKTRKMPRKKCVLSLTTIDFSLLFLFYSIFDDCFSANSFLEHPPNALSSFAHKNQRTFSTNAVCSDMAICLHYRKKHCRDQS
jgi:hypothetical protein